MHLPPSISLPELAASHPNMSHRGRSPKVSSKAPPYSPRLDGVGVLSSRGVPPSPLSKGLDGPPGSGSLPSVDYDDVFGGPPRFATSMLTSQSGPTPSAALDRATARTLSFRSPSPSLPVFELPVFGDDVVGSSSTFEPRPASVAYEDIFREEVQTPDVFPGSSVYGHIPRSKPSSRPSSRRMSPVHPAAALPSQLGQEEILAAANSAAFFKGRPSAGKLASRCSFSSFSSFDERGRPLDSPSMALKNDMVASSLPSSPPHASTWGHVKKFTGSNSANSLGVSVNGEVDDVFGGFPQRTYSQAFASVLHDVKDAPNASRTYGGGVRPTKFGAGNKFQSTAYASELYEGLNRSLSSSSSSNGEQGLHDDFIEIRMDRQSDSSVSEKMEASAGKVWVTVSDLNLSSQTTPKRTPARPPPAPVAPLKYKSWKDWTSDVPGGQSACPPSPGVVPNVTAVATTAPGIKKDLHGGNTLSHFVKGLAESGSSKQLQYNNISAEQLLGKYSGSLPLGSEVKAKLAEESLELEERELQALLTNAWKINEKRERKKTATKIPQEVSAVLEPKVQEPHVKEVKKHSTKQSRASQPQQSTPNLEDREADLHWKAWRKYSNKDRKESTKNGFANDNSPNVTNAQDLTQERDGNLAKLNALSDAEDSFDPEEIVKVVTEEMSTNCNVASTERSDRWAGVGINMKPGQRRIEDTEVLTKDQSPKVSKDENGAVSALSSANGSVQDFVQYSEQIEVSLSGGEDIDCLIGLDHTLDGFQEIEGESLERRKSRKERHLRAKERVAKALEEMQQRDAEVQRQQEEKQQLAVTSDRQIKRWAAGKEGNLRALLSNLQHVLWPECGWQPISLTDLIEGPDVKKAYRKATLFVHPDKVQQKGANLQQKYIAERVFDILQEAWKTFNMQELF